MYVYIIIKQELKNEVIVVVKKDDSTTLHNIIAQHNIDVNIFDEPGYSDSSVGGVSLITINM